MAIKLIKLTKEQKNCVQFKSDGELLIRGIPGSGKTTVVLERAIYLQQHGEKFTAGPKVILLTYNRALATYIRQMSRETNGEAVEAFTFHQWGSQLLKDSGVTIYRMIGSEKEETVRYAKNIVAKYGDPDFPKVPRAPRLSEDKTLIRFLSEEISWIKSNNVKDRNEYLITPRNGRGTQVHVSKAHRESIYDVYEKYQSLLRQKRSIDFDDVALLLIKNIDNIDKDQLPSHILIDEAQDLTPAQFQAIKLLSRRSLTIAADKGQQIYRRNFTWKSVGIDIRGGRNKFLGRTFRSTKQIIQLARSLQVHDKALLKDDDFLPSEDPDTNGPIPELVISHNDSDEVTTVINKVRQIQGSFPNDTVAIVAYSQGRLEAFEQELSKQGIFSVYIKSDDADFITPGVKLVSFHSSKGLEFDHVIVTSLRDGKIPYAIMEPGDDPDAYKATERRKLYVAMTRAKLSLTLSAVEPVSPFVEELDRKLYKKI